MQNVSVSVADLTVAYGRHIVLDRLSIDIEKGEFLVLLGSSGCGKSTLLNAIAGLQEIEDGTISISDRDVTYSDPAERGIGMVFQSYALYPRMTVWQNMSFGLQIRQLAKDEVSARVERTAELLHISHLLDRRPSDLSGGQRQRVAIGRALVRDVDVFLFDEPLSNLDAQLRTELRVELKKLHQSLGNTMIYVTHDQVEAMTLADRIAVMRDGRIQQLASPSEVYNRPANLFVAGFIGSPKMNFINANVGFEGSLLVAAEPIGRAQGMSSKGDVILGVRPEDIRLVDVAAVEAIAATVELTEDLGPETIVWLRLADDSRVSMRCAPGGSYPPGRNLHIGFDLSKISLFDVESETRIDLA